MTIDILSALDGKWEDGTRPKDLFANHIAGSPADYLPAILAGLAGEKRKVQSGCAELAALISETTPELLLPHADLFVANLDADAPVLRWEAVCVIGNLAALVAVPAHFPDTRVGFLAEAMAAFAGHDELRDEARAFAEDYLDHPSGAVARKAKRSVRALSA